MSKERPEPLNGDGFGLAWYDLKIHPEPARFRSITPAWNNINLREISQVITSECILAHVRAATQQMEVIESNCHPFKSGAFTFMHNGEIGGFSNIRRGMLSILSDKAFHGIHGTTDSEYFFALLMDNLEGDDTNGMVHAAQKTILQVVDMVNESQSGQYCYLNFILTNGKTSLAVRFTTDAPENAYSLYLNYGKRYTCENGVCYMEDQKEDEKAILVSSEPLTKDGGWESIQANHMILIKDHELIDYKSIWN